LRQKGAVFGRPLLLSALANFNAIFNGMVRVEQPISPMRLILKRRLDGRSQSVTKFATGRNYTPQKAILYR